MGGSAETAILSHGYVDRAAKETYGSGPTVLRIGNGGAGATGLVKALAEDYLSRPPHDASIGWVCNHSRNTQLALLYGYIDIALTYERVQEGLAAEEGWSSTAGCAFHDHFCLAGPVSDPANVRCVSSLHDAFSRIAASGALFHSRADFSATMWKERAIWEDTGIQPWTQSPGDAAQWYKTSLYGPAEALIAAEAAGAYLVTDRSTILSQTMLRSIHNTTVFFEPTNPDDVLMNSCYALTPTKPACTERSRETSRFLDYLFSEAGQGVVEEFGKVETGGFPLFAPVKEGFCANSLRGGVPKEGRWTIQTATPRL